MFCPGGLAAGGNADPTLCGGAPAYQSGGVDGFVLLLTGNSPANMQWFVGDPESLATCTGSTTGSCPPAAPIRIPPGKTAPIQATPHRRPTAGGMPIGGPTTISEWSRVAGGEVLLDLSDRYFVQTGLYSSSYVGSPAPFPLLNTFSRHVVHNELYHGVPGCSRSQLRCNSTSFCTLMFEPFNYQRKSGS